MVAVPAATAVTRPFASTVAADVLLESHTIERPVRTPLFASFVTAANCWVSLIPRTRATVAGSTVTVATGALVTVRVALPFCPSLVATMLAVPALTAVTTPVDASTVATAVLSELQLMARPLNGRLWTSSRMAVACVVCTAFMELSPSETLTVATGAWVTVIIALPL
jgi:hypothetical protein